jgi:hypothetical protein
LLRAGELKRVKGKQEEEIEEDGAKSRDVQRESDPGLSGRPDYQGKKHYARSSRVGAQ